jgi:hypothetical protein
MLQPGRPGRATAILELIAAWLSGTPDHPRCPDRDAGRNRNRHLKDGPWMRSE